MRPEELDCLNGKPRSITIHWLLDGRASHSIRRGLVVVRFFLQRRDFLDETEDHHCDKETDPMSSLLSQYVGKRVEISLTNGLNVKGVVLESADGLVKVQLDQTSPTTSPYVATYPISQVTSVIDLDAKGQGGGGSHSDTDSSHGKITVQVSVVWEGSDEHPEEVNVNFIREEIVTTIPTVSGIATFSSSLVPL